MTAPALAPADSLDTGQQFDISDVAARPQGRVLDPRIIRADTAKVALKEILSAASDAVYHDHQADAIALDAMADKLEDCRYGHASMDTHCGAWTFRPNSCHVRLCPDCERARSARLVARYDEIGGQMATPRLWTLTLPNVAPGELRVGLGVLLDALAHLRRRSIIKGGPCSGRHRAAAYTDVDRGEHHPSGDEVEECAHPPHRRELAGVGSCRCARCLEVDVERAGQRVTLNGCPRCTHEPVRGGVYSIEVTWSPERGDWHPHAHLLMDAPWIAWAEVRDAWRAVTCDAIRRAEGRGPEHGATTSRTPCQIRGQSVDRAPLPRCEHHADARGIATDGCRGASIVWVSSVAGESGSPERRRAVKETLKYVSKGLLDQDGRLLPGASPLDLAELLLAIRGRRLVAGWGTFRNVRDDDEDGLDPAEYLVGPDIMPEMVGLPRICPVCGHLAEWTWPRAVARANCRRSEAGPLLWQPPGPVQ